MEALQAAIGISFRRPALLRQALSHRSYMYEHPDEGLDSNERLEYLGDAVLTYVSSLYLYRRFPQLQEGQLTSLRAAAVRAETLAKFAGQIDLGRYLLLGRGEAKSGGRARPLLLSSAFEALTGAILLDRGLDPVTEFLERFLAPEFDDILAERRQENFKSRLQELTQGTVQATPVYRTVRASGPSHARTFEVEVLVKDEVAGHGSGHSKREAEQAAAEDALERLEGLAQEV
ncbi:MAG TPA: ribonuclease III [Chloroflexota bacterium]|nr:ribonuclease III [Chloroflexota bacterium]